MRVIGVDPGSRVTGYAVVEFDGNRISALDYGCIKPPSASPLSKRYVLIYDTLQKLISRFEPQEMAVESSFYCKNVSSALKLSQVRGVVLLAGSKANLDIYEYSPRKVKQAVVGHGSAAKQQVQSMVAQILSLEKPPASEDASDALAVAICHVHSMSAPHTRGKTT
ncbi:crossover junction endodeoxyribonuclease RuvC [bacterium]|nr:crossover junction endodeoxyribonuclease RuvC [bacterium]